MSDEGGQIRLRDGEVIWREVEDQVIILDKRNWAYLSVNDSGAILWQRLVDGATARELESALVERFGVTGERAAEDVDAFLRRLEDHGVIER